MPQIQTNNNLTVGMAGVLLLSYSLNIIQYVGKFIYFMFIKERNIQQIHIRISLTYSHKSDMVFPFLLFYFYFVEKTQYEDTIIRIKVFSINCR